MSDAGNVQPKPTAMDISEDVLKTLYLVVPEDVLAQLKERVEYGERKYGSRLKTFNGRNVLLDCRQEALDGIMYAQQAVLQGIPDADILRDEFVHLVKRIMRMEQE